MTSKEREKLAIQVAEHLHRLNDEMMPLKKVCEITGFSETYVYHNTELLGGVKYGGKWFFSKNNLNLLLRQGSIGNV